MNRPSHPRSCVFAVTGKDGQHDNDGLCDYCRARFGMSLATVQERDRRKNVFILRLPIRPPLRIPPAT